MGDGLVLEQGTHDELLSHGGAYASLVQAQKLREVRETVQTDADEDSSNPDEDMEKMAREEVPLGRKNTGQSLASQILEQRRKAQEDKKEKDHGLSYLFMRMGLINREAWRQYLFGTIAATSTFSGVPCRWSCWLSNRCSVWHGLSGIWSGFRQRYFRVLVTKRFRTSIPRWSQCPLVRSVLKFTNN
jgi:hypothetical protein